MHAKSRTSSSGNTTTTLSSTLNSNRVRSKENVLKMVSSKRQAVGNAGQKQNELRPSSSISDLFHQQKQANQSSARLKVLTQSNNVLETQRPLNISKLGATSSLYNKIILTQRK